MYLSVVISQSSAVANGGSVVAAPPRGGQAVVPPSGGGFLGVGGHFEGPIRDLGAYPPHSTGAGRFRRKKKK